MKDKVIRDLKELECFDAYVLETENGGITIEERDSANLWEGRSTENILLSSFRLHGSIEGEDYWYGILDKLNK